MNAVLAQLQSDLEALRSDVVASSPSDIHCVDPAHVAGACNLEHYLVLRSSDLRHLQTVLTSQGLSSLGRSESRVLSTIDAVLRAVRALAGTSAGDGLDDSVDDDSDDADGLDGTALLERNTEVLLGPRPNSRGTRIMVTMPTSAASDPSFAADLVEGGMDVARINCAHDDAETWRSIARNVREAAERSGRPVRILMDLAGPKLRTGPMETRPAAVRIRPVRNALGRVVSAGRVTLVPEGSAPGDDWVPVEPTFLSELKVGDEIELRDSRDAQRHLVVESVSASHVHALAMQTIYFANDVELRVGKHLSGRVSTLPPAPGFVTLRRGDVVTLGIEEAPTRLEGPVHLGCTLPEAIAALAPGHRVLFDDGKFAAEVLQVSAHRATLQILDAPPEGGKLREEKGINLPDTFVKVGALTEKDIDDLSHVAEFADAVSMSFVRTPNDVEELHRALDAIGADRLGVVLKIETGDAFRNLPSLLRVAMRRPAVGVMIARGDLAVEAGFERLAELQEEILWLCEAAHLPVIWATQVLDTLARTGTPSRSEVTDAAASQRAECVMLNKGPFILEAVSVLDDILRRMESHQDKKRPLLRQLRSWT